LSDPANTALDRVFGYDRIDRLLSLATNPATLDQSFTYDKVGNRLTRVLNGATTNYTLATTSNRLTAVGGIARTIDAAGNQTADGTSSFTYSDRGRLSGATTPLGSVTYAVNALGQRVRKTVGTTSTHYAFDLEGRLLGEYDATGAAIQETVWIGSTPVATIRPNGGTYQVFAVWADHLDTPRLVTDAAGQVRWEWANTDPFGANPANENPAGLGTFTFNLRFPGQLFDAETGTHYNYFRDFDPSIGRYIQSDPIGLTGGINTYAYAVGNPLAFIDPQGLEVGFGSDFGVGMAVPIIGRAIGLGFGAGLGFRQCCGDDGYVYNDTSFSVRFGLSFGVSAQLSGSGRGTVGGWIGRMPKCVDSQTGWFNGLDGAHGPISWRIRRDILSGGISPGGGGSVTVNIGEGKWSLARQKTDKRCKEGDCKQ
jgi:RHS repeat-associated protein